MATRKQQQAPPPPPPAEPPSALESSQTLVQADPSAVLSSLDALKTGLREKYGDHAAYGVDDDMRLSAIRWWLASGIMTLDNVMNSQGIPSGRIIEIFGKPESGKTTLATTMLAAAQRQNNAVGIVVDTENKYDWNYAVNGLGVIKNQVIGVDAETIDEAFVKLMDAIIGLRTGEMVIRSGNSTVKRTIPVWAGPIVAVIDSIGQAATAAEVKKYKEATGQDPVDLPQIAARTIKGYLRGGGHARMYAQYDVLPIFVNHTYTGRPPFPNAPAPEVAYGGDGIAFAASVRLHTRQAQKLYEGDREYGMVTRVTVKKNQVSPFAGKFDLVINRGTGVSEAAAIVDDLIRKGGVIANGAWFTFKWEGKPVKVQGKNKVAEFLVENEGAIDRILADKIDPREI